MNVNDPFGRLQQKRQRNYETLRDSLRSKGIDSPPAAQVVLKNVLTRALLMTAILAVGVLAAWLLFPQKIAMVIVLAGLALLWIVTAAVNGRRHVRRYIREELSD